MVVKKRGGNSVDRGSIEEGGSCTDETEKSASSALEADDASTLTDSTGFNGIGLEEGEHPLLARFFDRACGWIDHIQKPDKTCLMSTFSKMDPFADEKRIKFRRELQNKPSLLHRANRRSASHTRTQDGIGMPEEAIAREIEGLKTDEWKLEDKADRKPKATERLRNKSRREERIEKTNKLEGKDPRLLTAKFRLERGAIPLHRGPIKNLSQKKSRSRSSARKPSRGFRRRERSNPRIPGVSVQPSLGCGESSFDSSGGGSFDSFSSRSSSKIPCGRDKTKSKKKRYELKTTRSMLSLESVKENPNAVSPVGSVKHRLTTTQSQEQSSLSTIFPKGQTLSTARY